MKNIALGFLLAVVCMFTIATTVPNSIMTVKPSKSTSTVCFFGYADEIKSKILIYAKQGYIVKTNTGGEGWKHYIVVMEKY